MSHGTCWEYTFAWDRAHVKFSDDIQMRTYVVDMHAAAESRREWALTELAAERRLESGIELLGSDDSDDEN